ncbi:hypothetical protein M3P21_21125 [Ruegeria sp. 2012CJ41-6]|uniref:Uncharacterized protein n=1 Tax=Ruegeria spongiae TaxID=2942209 RepID=A0ABT0Q9C9_9RHOB|nr:hypothetical protein [Ruegeria spongiae]MCL6286022.1 hypothetical protein [Ruegeria spongiae]
MSKKDKNHLHPANPANLAKQPPYGGDADPHFSEFSGFSSPAVNFTRFAWGCDYEVV